MVQTSCQDRVQAHALPEQRQGEKGLFFQQWQGFFAAAKYKERKLFMDEIKVVPYIPDEDYDNPAMVVDFYEFTMANCLFLHGFKNTTLVFDMFFRKNPDNMGYSISAGQRKLTRFLLNYHFNEQDIRWLRTKGNSASICAPTSGRVICTLCPRVRFATPMCRWSALSATWWVRS